MVIRPIRVEIYSRAGCHLCDDAKAVIERTIAHMGDPYEWELTVTDIDQSVDLTSRYGTEIPVVLINGTEAFRYRVAQDELERKIRQLWNRSTS